MACDTTDTPCDTHLIAHGRGVARHEVEVGPIAEHCDASEVLEVEEALHAMRVVIVRVLEALGWVCQHAPERVNHLLDHLLLLL